MTFLSKNNLDLPAGFANRVFPSGRVPSNPVPHRWGHYPPSTSPLTEDARGLVIQTPEAGTL